MKKATYLSAFIILTVASIAGLAFWDEQRESAAALEDFVQDQTTLADSVAAELATHLAEAQRDARLIAAEAAEGRRADASLVDGYSSFLVRPAGAAREAAREGFRLSVAAAGGLVVDLVVPARVLLGGSARIARPGAVLLLVAPPEATSFYAVDGRALTSEELLRWGSPMRSRPRSGSSPGAPSRSCRASPATIDRRGACRRSSSRPSASGASSAAFWI